eukprot:scaffold79383_cov32-Tisochrysis_lutea.AAC.2
MDEGVEAFLIVRTGRARRSAFGLWRHTRHGSTSRLACTWVVAGLGLPARRLSWPDCSSRWVGRRGAARTPWPHRFDLTAVHDKCQMYIHYYT